MALRVASAALTTRTHSHTGTEATQHKAMAARGTLPLEPAVGATLVPGSLPHCLAPRRSQLVGHGGRRAARGVAGAGGVGAA